MNNAIILHGTSCSPNSYWLPSIKSFLEKNDYEVWVPQLPDADNPDLKKWLPFVLTGGGIQQGHNFNRPLGRRTFGFERS